MHRDIDEPDYNEAVEALKTRGYIQDAVAVLVSQMHGLLVDGRITEDQADEFVDELNATAMDLFFKLGVEPKGVMEQRLSEPDDSAALLANYHAGVL
jgi:hypothetical protein